MSALPVVDTTAPVSRLRLRVQGADGRARMLELAAHSEAEAVQHAASRGLRVLAIESSPALAASVAYEGSGRFPLSLFSQELLALLEAGLNLTEAVATLHAKERHAATRAVLASVLQGVREGRNFSDVLAGAPGHFPEMYVATVRASERTGDLPRALARYIAYELQFDAIRKKLVSTSIYPAMLLLVGGFVTLFLLGYVVPRFSVVYESSGREMQWMSAMLLAFGRAIHANWQIVLAAVAAAAGLLGWSLGSPGGRAAVLDQVVRLPWVAARADEYRLARFYRAVSLLLAAGIALPRALGMVGGLLGPRLQRRLAQARVSVEQGQTLSSALLAVGLVSPVAESLIKVGERSGQMAEMLERTARFQDEDFARWLDWASRLLEPVLMLVIGLVIGAVVLMLYMPIFDLVGSFE